ncbi:MAG: SDR family oxidoreductase, partial [Acidobacteriota bacterium]
CRLALRDWEVFGVFRSHAVEIPGVVMVRADLGSRESLLELIRVVRPQAVIHAAALADANQCQRNPSESLRFNVEGSVNLARLCSDSSIPLVFTSTDLVFDGKSAPYCEDRPPSPINVYGEHKAMAEGAVLGIHPEVVVCRLPLMFGPAGPAAGSFIQPMLDAMREGRHLRLFTDEFRTPASVLDVARGLLTALSLPGGILHLGGAERISRYDFGVLLGDVFGFARVRLTACLRRDVPMAAPRPADVSLDSYKARRLGIVPASLRDGLQTLRSSIQIV